MLKFTIISLLILQTSASFFDTFAPVESNFGRLVTDVVSDIKESIDCTILAVKHVFSLDGLFGSASDYDERCGNTRDQQATQTPYSYPTEEITNAPIPIREAKALSQEIDLSMSDASQQIKTIIENSNANQKIENVKISIQNESDRLTQIGTLLSQELNKIPENVRKKIDFKLEDHPSIKSLLNEIKVLYKIEQKDKSSAEANEVRRSFDEVLNILHVNDTGGILSDEDEVKEIVRNLGKMSNDSLINVESQVAQWTEEQNKQLNDIREIVISTGNEPETKSVITKLHTEEIINEKLDEIEKEQEKMIDFSKTLKDIAKNILDKVSAISTSKPEVQIVPGTQSNTSWDHANTSSIEKLSSAAEVRSATEQPIIEISTSTTEIVTSTKYGSDSTEPPITSVVPTSTSTTQPTISTTNHAPTSTVSTEQPGTATDQPLQITTQSYPTKTPATQPSTQQHPSATPQPQTNVLTPQSTEPAFPKTFKDVAKQIFQTTTAAPTEAPIDYDSLFSDGPENPNESITNQLFAPQDKASQKKAVEDAKNLIEQSQLTNKIMNDFFNNMDHASAPSIFDDPDIMSFFS